MGDTRAYVPGAGVPMGRTRNLPPSRLSVPTG